MLIDQETENHITDTVGAVIAIFCEETTGRELDQTYREQTFGNTAATSLTVLEKAYLLGKIAGTAGVATADRLTQAKLHDLIQTGQIILTDLDRVTLGLLKTDTQRFLQNKKSDWVKRVSVTIGGADREWAGYLLDQGKPDENTDRTRRKALRDLRGVLDLSLKKTQEELRGFLKTEIQQYYQNAQVVGLSADEEVYKIPENDTCENCQKIHLKKDGTPKTMRLGHVLGRTNWNKPRYTWKFNIGPLHPRCTCKLYVKSVDGPPN